MEASFIGIDQYNNLYGPFKHPRKDLLSKLGMKHASKMYMENKTNGDYHCGYVIGGLWISVYKITPIGLARKEHQVCR